MSKYELVKKCLEFSISKDETRFNLNGVYYNPSNQEAVSTDGFIMTVSKLKYVAEFADKIVDFKDMSIINKEFLKYQAVIPKKFEKKFTITIPKKDPIIKGKNQKEYGLYILANGEIQISREVPKDYLAKFNPHFFKPLQGETLKVGYNGELNPIKIELIEDDSYYIIMPIKV